MTNYMLARLLAVAGTALLACSGACIAEGVLPRGSLWVVVQTCVLAKKTTGTALPCLEVRDGRPGYAILRPPLGTTHILVAPTDKVAGIEDPVLQRPDAAAYWRAALDARRLVFDAAGRHLPQDGVGMAVNSAGSRTQDQLHIHVDCVNPQVHVMLRANASAFSGTWKRLPFPFRGRPAWGKRVADVGAVNLFSDLAGLPGERRGLARVAVAVFSAAPPQRGFYVVALESPRSQAERLLDHSCALSRGLERS